MDLRIVLTSNALWHKIRNLVPGQKIIILCGEGYPATQKETVAIVWRTDGPTALCTDGTMISPNSVSDIILTRTKLDPDTLVVSDLAIRLDEEATARVAAWKQQYKFNDSEPE